MLQEAISTVAQPAHVDDPGRSLALDDLQFDTMILEKSLADSGVDGEFDLDHDTQLILVAQGLVIVSFALSAENDEDFEASLRELEPPGTMEELAFLFGYCEHARKVCLEPFPEDIQEALRKPLATRLARAREHAKAGVLVLS